MTDDGTLHRRTKNYGKLPAKLMHDLTVTDGAKVLYAHMHWRYGNNHQNYEGLASMSKLLGVTQKTIGNRIKELEATDWVISINRGVDKDGNFQTLFYHVFEYQEDCIAFRQTYQPKENETVEPKPEARKKIPRSGKGNKAPVNPHRENSGSDGEDANRENSGSDGRENSGSDGVPLHRENSGSHNPVTSYPVAEIIQSQKDIPASAGAGVASKENSDSPSDVVATEEQTPPIPSSATPLSPKGAVFDAWAVHNFDYTDTSKVDPAHEKQIWAFVHRSKEAYKFQFEVDDSADTALAVWAFCIDWRRLQNGKAFSNADTMRNKFAPFLQSKWKRVEREPEEPTEVLSAEEVQADKDMINATLEAISSFGGKVEAANEPAA